MIHRFSSIASSEYIHCSSPYLLTEIRPLEGDHADVNGVGDKCLVVHELVGGEGGDRVEEELSSLLEVPDGHTVKTLVDLQAIPSVPVAPLLNEAAEKEQRYVSTEEAICRDVSNQTHEIFHLFAFSELRVMRSLSM